MGFSVRRGRLFLASVVVKDLRKVSCMSCSKRPGVEA